jgi:hypothetical protein
MKKGSRVSSADHSKYEGEIRIYVLSFFSPEAGVLGGRDSGGRR